LLPPRTSSGAFEQAGLDMVVWLWTGAVIQASYLPQKNELFKKSPQIIGSLILPGLGLNL